MKRRRRSRRQVKLERLYDNAWTARESYYVTRSDAARKRLKRALKNWLLAGGTIFASRAQAEAGD